MLKKINKNATLTVRIKEEPKAFFKEHRGLAGRVLEDFYFQWKTMMDKEIKLEKEKKGGIDE